MDTKKSTGIVLVGISAVSFGFMPIFARFAYASGCSVNTLLFLRFLAGALFMFLLMYVKKIPLPGRKEIISLLLLGSVGYTCQALCYFNAIKYTTAGTAALLLYIYPALVMAGSVLFFKEKVTLKKILALVSALLGAFIVVGGDFQADLRGIILALAAAVLYSVYILISSVVVKENMGISGSAFIMLGTAFSYGILTLITGFCPPTDLSGSIAVVLISIVSTVIAMWAFFTGMQKTGPSTASLVSILEPIATVLASALILSEKLTTGTLIGGTFIIAALVVTALSEKKIE